MTPSSPNAPASDRLLSVACPSCTATIAVDVGLLGKAAECPLCGRGFRLPAATATAPPSRPHDAGPPRATVGAASTMANTVPARAADESWSWLESGADSPEAADETANLKRASADRTARRTRRNVVMLIAGGSILLGIVMLLGRKRR